MKIHLDPLWKGRKKPDLEETISNPIEETGIEEQEENGRKMEVEKISLKEYLNNSLKSDNKDLCRGWDYLKTNITEQLKEVIGSKEYWDLPYDSKKADFILKSLNENLNEEQKKQLDAWVYIQNDLKSGQEEQQEQEVQGTEEKKAEKEYEEKEKEEIRVGHSPFFGLYFKDTAKEKEKARRKEEKARRREEKEEEKKAEKKEGGEEEKKAMRDEGQKKEKEEGEEDLYKKPVFEEYKQLYEQEIRKAFSEGNEYLRRGEREKAAEKYKEGWDMYNSLKTLDSDPALKSILQQGAGKKEGLEEKVTEEKVQGEIPEEKLTEGVVEKEQDYKKEKKAKEKKKKQKEHYRLKVGERFFRSKWWGLIPTVAGSALGLAGGIYAAAALAVPLGIGAAIAAACAGTGAALGGKVEISKDNWYIQGRTKFIVNWGQHWPYIGEYPDTWFLWDVLEKDYTDTAARDGLGDIVRDENGNTMQGKPRWKHLWKLADKILPPREKLTTEEIAEMEKHGKEDISELYKTYGRPSYSEVWFEDPVEKDWDRHFQICENFKREHEQSKRWLKEKYPGKAGKGLICLDTVIDGHEKKYWIDEVKRPLTDLWGHKKGLFGKISYLWKNKWGLLPKMLKFTRYGKLYMVYKNTVDADGRPRTQMYFLEKEPLKSLFYGTNYVLRNNLFEPVLAEIDKRLILSTLIKRPRYYIKFYDEEVAKDRELKVVLTMLTQYLNRDSKQHKFRFSFNKATGKPTMYNPAKIITSQDIDYSQLRPESIFDR